MEAKYNISIFWLTNHISLLENARAVAKSASSTPLITDDTMEKINLPKYIRK